MKIKKFLSVIMCIAIAFAALPIAAYAQEEAPITEAEQTSKIIDFDALKEKAEDAFEGASFFGYWGIYFGLASVLGVLALPISPFLAIFHQINKAISNKKSVTL